MSLALFGTDGIRGKMNQHPITPEFILKLGMVVGAFLKNKANRQKKVLIAKDTRLSCYLLESALTSGLLSVGVNVVLAGPVPTPTVAYLTKEIKANFGIMISASHNPYHDNGLKFFDARGCKLSTTFEEKLQDSIIHDNLDQFLVPPDRLGGVSRLGEDHYNRYIDFLLSFLPSGANFSGIKVVLDCANGAAHRMGPALLQRLGVQLVSISNQPDGFNINQKCGSTYPRCIAKAVKIHKADIGIALDGDADRALICDERGAVISGDHLIGMIALYMKEAGQLSSSIVVTHLSNLALDDFLKRCNVKVHRTNVGDKNVMEMMCKKRVNFGAEQSGHIMFRSHSTTGDGLLTALQILQILQSSGKKLSKIARPFILYPQLSLTHLYDSYNPLDSREFNSVINKLRVDYPDVRLLVRKSGTEKALRVVAEGKEYGQTNSLMQKVRSLLNLSYSTSL